MWRTAAMARVAPRVGCTLALACALACLALPAASRADTPGFSRIGPPATLNGIAYGAGGVLYGTVAWNLSADVSGNPVTLWRSHDHGRTWAAVYQLPYGWGLAIAGTSPIDPDTVYVYQWRPREQNGGDVVRVDAVRGRGVPLPLGRFLGVDAEGTAYGLATSTSVRSLVRCRRRADSCSQVRAPAGLNWALPDPNAAGVLAGPGGRGSGAERGVLLSTDGGGTWTAGQPAPNGILTVAFAGPGARTLYARDGIDQLLVSRDAGLTWHDSHTVAPGTIVVGSHPAGTIGAFSTAAFFVSGDDGATTRSLPVPYPGRLAVDPSDAQRMAIASGDQTMFSDDGGSTWRELADRRFGTAVLDSSKTTGSGSSLYSAGISSIRFSGDAGATWGRALLPPPVVALGFFVSRDDPRTAYAPTFDPTDRDNTGGMLRTRDGGATWQAVRPPPNLGSRVWIVPGEPLHLFATYGASAITESLDGGATWSDAPTEHGCFALVVADPATASGERLRCMGWWSAADPLRPLAAPLPFASGMFAAPDAPGAYAFALKDSLGHQDLLGDVTADWTWSSRLGPTGEVGPALVTAEPLNAWPAAAGTTFYARDARTGITWVRRGTGRWWRLAVAGRDVTLLSALDATHTLVSTYPQYGPIGVVDLALPPVASPLLREAAGGLVCSAPWSSADADLLAYGWMRDGAAIAGATSSAYAPAPRDAGHSLACTATARTDFGTSVTTSAQEAIPAARIALTGSARMGALLRCGATSRIDWLRDGAALKSRHARTYRVRAADAGHALGCQTHRADGGLGRSRTLTVSA